MAALISADTGWAPPGAPAAATHAAAPRRPSTRTRPGTARTPHPQRRRQVAAAAAARRSLAAGATQRQTSSPSRIATNPAWVITAYHQPASPPAARCRCSATPAAATSAPSAPSTQQRRRRSPPRHQQQRHANTGRTACTPRPPRPVAWRRCRTVPPIADDQRRDRHEQPAQRVDPSVHPASGSRPGGLHRLRSAQPRAATPATRSQHAQLRADRSDHHAGAAPARATTRPPAPLPAPTDGGDQTGCATVHRPVRPRNAATIASGGGGQPGPPHRPAPHRRPPRPPRTPRRTPRVAGAVAHRHHQTAARTSPRTFAAAARPCCGSPARSPATHRRDGARRPAGRRTAPRRTPARTPTRSRSHTRCTTRRPRAAPAPTRQPRRSRGQDTRRAGGEASATRPVRRIFRHNPSTPLPPSSTISPREKPRQLVLQP